MPEIKQILPKESSVELEGLYLRHNLRELAEKLGRPFVIANYITDINDVIARKSVPGAASEIKNSDDWKLFQELTTQADAIITGTNYLNELAERDQNILTQFEANGDFAHLGEWRLGHGYKSRSPDILVISRSLDFEIPKEAIKGGRKVIVFTTNNMATSEKAERLEAQGATVAGAGQDGVNGAEMMQHIREHTDYKVIKNTTGPRILKILLDAAVLDRLYITQVQRTIEADRNDVVTVLGDKKVTELERFKLIEKYTQDPIVTADGTQTSQEFLVYDKYN